MSKIKNYYHISKESFFYKIIEDLDLLNDKYIIFLNGAVGSGKTTFVKSYLSYMGASIDVTSPTFTIVNEYLSDSKKIYHYDFYRLKEKNELFEIGIDYYLDQPGIHFIEWPNYFLNYLPEPDMNISLIILPNSRLVKTERRYE
tara:strand:- start:1026 stop:1457 length:432 start_codon:yes stop_codon:yes gene_type:complete